MPGTVLVDTVARFKGLESPVVLLWIGEEVSSAEEGETVHAGTSRAKYLMHAVGSAKSLCGTGAKIDPGEVTSDPKIASRKASSEALVTGEPLAFPARKSATSPPE